MALLSVSLLFLLPAFVPGFRQSSASPAVSLPHTASAAPLLPSAHIWFPLLDQDLGMCFTLGSVFFSMVLFITYSFFPSSLFIQAYNSHPPTVGISEGSCLANGRVFLPICFVSVVVLSLLKSLFLALCDIHAVIPFK